MTSAISASKQRRLGYPEPVIYQGEMMGWWVGPDGVQVRETFGCTLEELRALVPVPLTAAAA